MTAISDGRAAETEVKSSETLPTGGMVGLF